MKQLFFAVVLILTEASAFAQYYSNRNRQYDDEEEGISIFDDSGAPTRHEGFADYYVMGGYQHLSHASESYNVVTAQAEILFSRFGSRVSLTTGPDYLSFSPWGIILFAPRAFANTMKRQSTNPALLPFMIIAISAAQWHIPLTDHLEISAGWDALKFTKMEKLSDSFYITGSINAGLTFFLNNHLFVNGYYEFNHTHNTILGLFSAGSQPKELKGHSFGARIGWMF